MATLKNAGAGRAKDDIATPARSTQALQRPRPQQQQQSVPAWISNKKNEEDIPWWEKDVSIEQPRRPVPTGSFLSNNGQVAYGNNQTNLYQGSSIPSWMNNSAPVDRYNPNTSNRPNINTNYYTTTTPTGSFLSNNGQVAYGNNRTNTPSQSVQYGAQVNPNYPTTPTGSFLSGNGSIANRGNGTANTNPVIPNWMFINPRQQVGWVAGAGNINPNYPTVPTGSFLSNNGQTATTSNGQTQSSYQPFTPIGNRQVEYTSSGIGPQVQDGNIYNNNAPGTTQFGTPNMGVNTFIGGGGEAVRSPQARGRTMFGQGAPGTIDPALIAAFNAASAGGGGDGGGFGSRYSGNWRGGGGGGGGGWDYGGGGSNDYPAWVKTLMGLNSWNIK